MHKVLVRTEKKIRYKEAFINRKVEEYLTKKNIKFSTEKKYKKIVFAHDWIGMSINLEGIYERDILELLILFLKENYNVDFFNKNVLDIGANIGNHSLFFCEYFNFVHAIEAHPEIFKVLNINSSFVDNISVYNLALDSGSNLLNLNESLSNIGSSSFIYNTEDKGNIYKLKTCTLDSIKSNFGEVGLIKIDVEGMESRVLQGAKNFIEKFHPIIVFEQHEKEFNENAKTEAIELLEKFGYSDFLYFEERKVNQPQNFFTKILDKLIYIFKGRKYENMLIKSKKLPIKNHNMIVALYKGAK